MKGPLKYVRPFLVKHEPELLMAMGISGLLFATAWGIKSTFKVSKKIDEYKKVHNCTKLTARELVKLTWKEYLPVVISTAVSIPCIIGGNRVSNKRYAALATAYTISETALQEYQDQTRLIVGEKKAQEIQEAANEETIKKTYPGKNQVIMTSNGNHKFYEPLTDRYFESTWNKIQKAANELNAKALGEVTGVITLNEWFEALGLPETAIGDQQGWSITGNTGGTLIDISISTHLTSDNEPCGAISYKVLPAMLKDSLY